MLLKNKVDFSVRSHLLYISLQTVTRSNIFENLVIIEQSAELVVNYGFKPHPYDHFIICNKYSVHITPPLFSS